MRLRGDLIGDSPDAIPTSRSQERRWTREIRARLGQWVRTDALPIMAAALTEANLSADAVAEKGNLFIRYEPLGIGTGYVRPAVMLEFGAPATGEPWEVLPVVSDAAAYIPELTFPSAWPHVMKAERTFWEKATAIHVFCAQGRFRGAERFARHWHDISRLGEAGYAARAIADTEIAMAVARHKTTFFPEKDSAGDLIDYQAAVSGALSLVPDGSALELLVEDYRKMVDDGLLLDDAEPFDVLIERCRQIQEQANAKLRL
ncbi:nucleotidyltransferase AbiEii toxin of type IV toxin-antitoxin system [Mesorhizobium tianshanense]|uniref:Nucleotidyltransferase AbiEii toxin of type IV toxin-antitoxin system n=1 Tax=Mesorhizobium tianshanense TaxID=39844 RepID=A0A562MVY0_9HYPH|nr:nucleotidyltransferase AbiEii toxin of type IV toxin-antitoxin system [Mesorhizobium tianshanense]